ncbi:MAG: hypothetical protein ACOZQL_41365 [Myxococcota bacterium]
MGVEDAVDGVLRVLGRLDLKQALTDFPVPESVWSPGQVPGRPLDCGFNILLFEGVGRSEYAERLTDALSRLAVGLGRLPAGVAEVDLGLYSPNGGGSLHLSAQLMSSLSVFGLGVSVTVYACDVGDE